MLLQDGVSLVRENAESEKPPKRWFNGCAVLFWWEAGILPNVNYIVAFVPRSHWPFASEVNRCRRRQMVLTKILVEEVLPPALEMKDDRVTNVRLTLIQVLRVMPLGVQKLTHVQTVVNELEDEAGTWESMHYVNTNTSTTTTNIVPKQLVESSPGGAR
eukprot:scaffold257909_cov66-Attheya_sp.AAC.2